MWLVISGVVLVWLSGFVIGTAVERHTRRKCSIPPSESLDTVKRMRKLVTRKEDEDASHSRRTLPDRRCRRDNESCEKVKLHWGEK